MIYWLFLLIEFMILFLTSKILFKSFSFLVYRFTKSQKAVITFLAILFFPGIVIHELAHLIVAGVLFVRVHGIEFLPEIHGDQVKLGSVQISQTDFMRRFLIGVAPVVIGIMISGIVIFYAGQSTSLLLYICAAYAIFVISNTMFSSKKDLEGAIVLFIILIISMGGLLFVNPNLLSQVTKVIISHEILAVVKLVNILLLVPMIINLVTVAVFKAVLK